MTTTTTGPFRLGDLLRRARLDAELDQEDIAVAAGVSRPLVSKWERGNSEPTVTQLRSIADTTGAEYLYDLRELPSRCTTVRAA